MIMKYNIIGDVHGRKVWKELVIKDAMNIFVGDYFDPYENISFEEMKQNFLDIIEFKKENDVILLLGNHDLHYIYGAESTRYDYENAGEIKKLFNDNLEYFTGVAYSINDRVLITHAGVTKEWLEYCKYDGDKTPDKLKDFINGLLWDRIDLFKFNGYRDYYGTDPQQGPTWVRPNTLLNHNALEDYIQIVGHTKFGKIIEHTNIKFIDCLGDNAMSLLIEVNEKGDVKYTINT